MYGGCCIGALVRAGVWFVSPMLDSGYMPLVGTIPRSDTSDVGCGSSS